MLLKFYTALVLSVVSLSASSSPPHEVVFDPLALLHVLCQCLDAASAPYNLPLLEASLECLLHLSARYVTSHLVGSGRTRQYLLPYMYVYR